MAAAAVQAIVFDFGGVFTHSQASLEQLRGYDAILQLPPDTLHRQLYSGEAWELASTGQITEDEYWERVGRAHEADLPAEFRTFRQGMFWAEPIDEEMVALACRLHRHFRLALCSNALPELVDIMRARPDLGTLFEVQVISALVGIRKPDPAMFGLVADRLGLPLNNCLLIDDKVRNTDAANSVGMPAILFQSPVQLVADLAARGLWPAD